MIYFLRVVRFCLQGLFEGLTHIDIHQIENSFPLFLEYKYGYPHNT